MIAGAVYRTFRTLEALQRTVRFSAVKDRFWTVSGSMGRRSPTAIRPAAMKLSPLHRGDDRRVSRHSGLAPPPFLRRTSPQLPAPYPVSGGTHSLHRGATSSPLP